jgi:hypothetical protein
MNLLFLVVSRRSIVPLTATGTFSPAKQPGKEKSKSRNNILVIFIGLPVMMLENSKS